MYYRPYEIVSFRCAKTNLLESRILTKMQLIRRSISAPQTVLFLSYPGVNRPGNGAE